MAKIEILNESGQAAGEIDVPAGLFSYPVKPHLLYEVAVEHQAKERRGTAATKTRAEVSGSNRKPWRQKGTGRARVGSIRSPLWRKGGTVHGPQPRDYKYDIPKQARQNALRSALTLRFSEKRLLVLADASLKEPKTKEAARLLKALGLDSALLVDQSDNKNLFVAVRNIPKVKAADVAHLSVFDVLAHKWLVFSRRAFETLIGRIEP